MTLRLSSLLLLSWPALLAAPAHAVIKCTDEKGVTYYGDTLPPQCEKRAITEINKQGTVVRRIDAAQTPEQLKAREGERLKNAEYEKHQAAQKLKDQALMSTYGAEREFDRARDRDLGQLDARQKILQTRMVELDKIIANLGNEMEFYRAGKSKKSQGREAPPQLANDFKRATTDRESLERELIKIDGDKITIAARYDTEKGRWKRLKSGVPPGTLNDEEKAAIDAALAAKAASGGKAEPTPKAEPAKTVAPAKKP